MTEQQWVAWFARSVWAVSFALLCLGSWLVSGVLARLLWDADDLFPDIAGSIRSYIPRVTRRASRPHSHVSSQRRSFYYTGREADRAGAAQLAPSLPASGGAA